MTDNTIHMEGCWSPFVTKWIHEFIEGIPTYLEQNPHAHVGHVPGAALGKAEYECYVVKTEQPYMRAMYFQPYHLRDREPICGIEVNLCDDGTYRYVVHAMNCTELYTE
jgi:hypothetical protein